MTIKELRRPAFEQAVIDRMKEGGFLEVEIRVECLARSGDGYYDGSVDAYWHFWNTALDGVVMELPLAWKPQGEANFYAITENGNWLAIVQLNGELLREEQEEWMRLFTGQNMRITEAKAHGVVIPPSPYMPGSQPTDFTDYELGEIHGRIAMWEEVKRLNTDTVQQASVRDGYVRVPVEPTEAMIFAGCEALVGSIGGYEAGQVERCYDAMLIAAPAAPAADAGASSIEWTKDAAEWGGALNYAAWEFVNECPEKSALLFNNTKGPLRAAIMKYAEIVTAHRAQGLA